MRRRNFLKYAALPAIFPSTAIQGIFPENKGWIPSLEGKSWIAREKDLISSLEKAIHPVGGIRGIISGRPKVLVKPTMAFDHRPGTGYNSDPMLVKIIIEWCYKAGAREVSVLDQTRNEWTQTYKNSGIERAAKDASARVYPANDIRYYMVPETMSDKTILVHQALANADIVINMPVVAWARENQVRGALENYLGLIWNRDQCYGTRQKACITSLLNYKAPQLTIAEIWPENKPSGSLLQHNDLRYISVSDDMVLSDQASAYLLGLENSDISGLKEAISTGLGREHPLPEQIIKL